MDKVKLTKRMAYSFCDEECFVLSVRTALPGNTR